MEKEFNAVQKECLKSLEALCVFGYREFYKNFLLLLVEMQDALKKSQGGILEERAINHLILEYNQDEREHGEKERQAHGTEYCQGSQGAH